MRISVVMPALNEASNVRARCFEVASQSGDWEWIVADGGSNDGTAEIARDLGATVIRSARGRGLQLDAGAGVATGDVLLFLHADTALPAGAFEAIRALMRRRDVVGGNFALRFDERTAVARLFEALYATRQFVFGTFFGDSAIFVRRATFERIGGFGDAPIMEDYAFAVSLRKSGVAKRIPLPVVTSSRRYRGKPMRTLLNWIAIMSLYRAGVPPARLARMYRAREPLDAAVSMKHP